MDKPFKQKTQWYVVTDVDVQNYYGSNLTTSVNSKITECDGEKLNWDAVDIEFYNQVIKDRESMFNQKICYKEILNTSIDLFTCCSNKFQPKSCHCTRHKSVHYVNCRRRMKPTVIIMPLNAH